VEAAKDQDRLLSYGPFDYTYTANGELETKTNRYTGEAWLFQYDALGNLLTVALPNGDLVEYLVDGMGRRVGKKKNGVLLRQWIYRDALKPVAELDGPGNLVAEFVYGSKTNVPDYVRRGGATYRVISDQLGSPRYVVNVANASDVPFTASYTSFGVVTGNGFDWMPFGFAGGIYDAAGGLVRFGARDYAPLLGRWLAKDPSGIAIGGANQYSYTDEDPINRFDIDGRTWDSPECRRCQSDASKAYNDCVRACDNICGEDLATCQERCGNRLRDALAKCREQVCY
jgi:RHS repeat-associated protein